MNVRALLEVDWSLFIVMTALFVLGLVMIFSSSAISAYQMVDSLSYFFNRQIIWGLIGMGVCFIATTVSLDTLKRVTPAFYVLVAVLLGLVLVPFIGREAGGARRWIDLGFVGFQPSELAKIALILISAKYLSSVSLKDKDTMRDLVVVGGFTLLYAFLIAMEPDVGTAFQISLMGLIMLFLAGFSVQFLALVVVMATPVAALVVFMSGYRSARVVAYLDPWGDPLDKGYHTIQSMKALGAGGLTGEGLGESVLKMGYLPEPFTDSIVAVIGEELGYIGILILMLLIGYLVVRGFMVSLQVKDNFHKLVGLGLTTLIAIQAGLNLAVVSSLIPTTGISMPFISYGGSSLVINMAAIGLIMNISRRRST